VDDDLFPSGEWTGFYNYTGPEDRHRMDLRLDFAHGRMTGNGADNVGPFVIRGSYDNGTKECSWVKTYPGSHDVRYSGCGEAVGIWGTWTIPAFCKGGFHIWPRRAGKATEEKLEAVKPVPAKASVPNSPTRSAMAG
jgi:hypothetical protein